MNDLTHTLYVANNADGDHPGTVSVINTTTCNGADTAGCGGHHPSIPVGRSSRLAAVDNGTDRIYITNYSSATVSIIDGSTCNSTATSGCAQPAPQQAVGSQPNGLVCQRQHQHRVRTNPARSRAMSIFAGAP